MITREVRMRWITTDGREFTDKAEAEAHEMRERLTGLLERHGVHGSVLNGVTLADALLKWREQN